MLLFLAVIRDGPATRQRVLDAIMAHPGITKNQLKTDLGVNWHTVDHHVQRLALEGLVHENRGHWSHGLFDAAIPEQERLWLRALHDEDGIEVIAAVAVSPQGVYGLSDKLQRGRKSVLGTITGLLKDGVVEKLGANRPRYKLARPPPGVEPFIAALTEPSLDPQGLDAARARKKPLGDGLEPETP